MVFHAQYLAFMERARTELLNAAGFDLARMADKERVIFLVHELKVRFHGPGRLNDVLSADAEVVKMGRASVVFRQRVERGDELLAEAEVTLALANRDTMKPTRMPDALEQVLQ